ncbi:hypothetical protein [Chryseolinea sp. H1M3-3]|uniref:hypothetical protein n=1 Tax=Chryseolinea sp. H1M3-3 TaxID=3034144 RepID=UPI0023EC3125|nr:hypothetical protein [Chryseolinea sp. H1M3-3]
MKRWIKIIAWVIGSVVVVFFLFALWYRQTYSMNVAAAFEVNNPSHPQHILIATQGSDFKDSVVHELIREFKSKQMYIKVIDITDLPSINEDTWTALIIIHTWEYSKPPREVKSFVDRTKDKKKLIVLTTSGDGNYKIEGIDAITSASKLSDVSINSAEIINRVNNLLSTQ